MIDSTSTKKTTFEIFYRNESSKQANNRYVKRDNRQSDDYDYLDLAGISSSNRTTDTWDVLERLTKGICLCLDKRLSDNLNKHALSAIHFEYYSKSLLNKNNICNI